MSINERVRLSYLERPVNKQDEDKADEYWFFHRVIRVPSTYSIVYSGYEDTNKPNPAM